MHEEFECNSHIMEKIETEEMHGVTYGRVISNTEKAVASWIIEYTISSGFEDAEKWKETHVETSQQGRSQS